MIINDISLYLDPDDTTYTQLYPRDFSFRNRYVLHYVRRRLQALRLRSNEFRDICIRAHKEVDGEECRVTSDASLVVKILFLQGRYDRFQRNYARTGKTTKAYHEFFIEMLMKGIDKAALHYAVPVEEIQGAIADFRAGGYRNEWTHRRQRLPAPYQGVYSELACRMDTSKFTLTLRLERRGDTVFEREILTEDPEEICFAHELNKVVVKDRSIVVVDKWGDAVFTLKAGKVPKEATTA